MNLPQLLPDNNNNDDDEGTLYYKKRTRKKNTNNNNGKSVIISNSNNDLALTNVVQVIMKRDLWDNHNNTSTTSSSSSFDLYQKIIQPGVHVKLIGYSGPKDNDPTVVVFYCQKAQYTLANDDPRHLRNVLHYILDGSLNIHDVIQALPCITLDELTSRLDEAITRSSTNKEVVLSDYLEQMATDILAKFPTNYLSNPSKLAGCTNNGKRKLLPYAPLVYLTVPSLFDEEEDDDDLSSSSTNNDKEDAEEEVLPIANVIIKYNQYKERQQIQNQVLNDARPQQYKQYTISGWVQNRRRYQDNVTVLEMVDEFASLSSSSSSSSLSDTSIVKEDDTDTTDEWNFTPKEFRTRKLYCVIHPNALIDSSGDDTADIYGNVLCPGAHVKLSGYITSVTTSNSHHHSTENNEIEYPVFWTTTCQLLRSSWRPSAVRYILDLLHKGKFDINEASTALNLPYTRALDIAQGGNNTNSIAQRRWLAAELTQELQQGAKSRAGKITSAMIESLQVYEHARVQYPVTMIPLEYELDWSPPADDHRSNLSSSSSEEEISSRWQRTKKPQLKFMIDQIELVLRSHPDYGKRKLKVIDVGGGKGLLSNVLAEMFGSDIVQVQVVDTSISATNNGMIKARQRGLQNIQYVAQDATTLDISIGGVDVVVVALHACGALSDVALGHASVHGAAFIICPCCFLSNPHLQVVSLDGKLENSTTTTLIPTETWLTVDPIQYGQLKQLAEIQGDINIASKAMHTICGLRAMTVDRLWRQSLPKTKLDISIKQFPVGFSTRNFCLVGQIKHNEHY
jgi:hypothetical protein